MRVLVTGFSTFPGVPENPTEWLAGALGAGGWSPPGASAFRAEVLRTEYAAAAAALDAALAEADPDVMVGFGVHPGAREIRVECVARNRRETARPDNAGALPAAVAVPGGPAARGATLALAAVHEAVRTAGAPVRLSHDAGGYLCNDTFYRALHWNAARGRGAAVGFVHVPPLAVIAAPRLLAAATAAIAAAVAAHGLSRAAAGAARSASS